MKKLIPILLIVAITMGSCGFPCKNAETYRISDITLQYFSFQEGSYWVYENSSDATDIDTLMLVDRESDFIFDYTEKSCDGDYYENTEYKLFSKRKNNTILSVRIHSNPNYDFYTMRGEYQDLKLTHWIDTEKRQQKFSGVPSGNTIEMLDSYTVLNETFMNVIKRTTNYSPYPDKESIYYYAPDIGLIEFSEINEQTDTRNTYLLKDYKIIR